MKGRIAGALVGAGLAFWAQGAMAQQTGGETECVSAQTDWSVCVWPNPKECWGVSKPKESTAVNSAGRTVSVRRGDILLFVTFRPGAGNGEISFTGGYPFAQGQPVTVTIDGQKFDLIPGAEGASQEWAWPQDDGALMAAMRRGSTAVVTARSGRGNQTTDTFSLSGFTAAMTEAQNRCK